MEKPFETIWQRFASDLGIQFPGGGGAVAQSPDYRTARMLEHIDRGLHSLHAKVDHINRRLEDMDAHVKTLSDAVNNIVATINTTTAAITDAVAKLTAGIDADDDSAIDAAVANLNTAASTLTAANIALSGANKTVAAASGGQAVPASGATAQTIDAAAAGGLKPDHTIDPAQGAPQRATELNGNPTDAANDPNKAKVTAEPDGNTETTRADTPNQ